MFLPLCFVESNAGRWVATERSVNPTERAFDAVGKSKRFSCR